MLKASMAETEEARSVTTWQRASLDLLASSSANSTAHDHCPANERLPLSYWLKQLLTLKHCWCRESVWCRFDAVLMEPSTLRWAHVESARNGHAETAAKNCLGSSQILLSSSAACSDTTALRCYCALPTLLCWWGIYSLVSLIYFRFFSRAVHGTVASQASDFLSANCIWKKKMKYVRTTP